MQRLAQLAGVAADLDCDSFDCIVQLPSPLWRYKIRSAEYSADQRIVKLIELMSGAKCPQQHKYGKDDEEYFNRKFHHHPYKFTCAPIVFYDIIARLFLFLLHRFHRLSYLCYSNRIQPRKMSKKRPPKIRRSNLSIPITALKNSFFVFLLRILRLLIQHTALLVCIITGEKRGVNIWNPFFV